MIRFDFVGDYFYFSFNCGKVGFDGLGLIDQFCIFFFVVGNIFFKFSDNMVDFVCLKRELESQKVCQELYCVLFFLLGSN